MLVYLGFSSPFLFFFQKVSRQLHIRGFNFKFGVSTSNSELTFTTARLPHFSISKIQLKLSEIISYYRRLLSLLCLILQDFDVSDWIQNILLYKMICNTKNKTKNGRRKKLLIPKLSKMPKFPILYFLRLSILLVVISTGGIKRRPFM